nr:tetratricopeptide repeat protein [uncultured Devosia sp.]
MARAPAKPAAKGAVPRKRTPRQPVAAPAIAEVAPRKPGLRVSLPSLESGSTRLRKVILNIAFVLAILIFIPILASQFLRSPVLIEPIAVPEALVERGLTPEVVASRLWDGLRDANALARTSKASVAAIPNSQRVQFSVPDVGLSMDSIVRQTRQFFNIYETRIAGEFVCADAACAPEGMVLRLRVLRGTSEVIDLPAVGEQDLRRYFTSAAVQILSILDPFVAVSAISETEPVRATALARRLIRQHHPDAKWAHNLIGNLRSAAEDYRPALAEYRAALALDPQFTIAQANAARALRQLGDPVASRAEYDAILARDPQSPEVQEGYAELAIGAGDIDAAVRYLEAAAALDPTSPHYFARIGEVEMARGNIDAAKGWFTRSLAIDPAYPLAISPMFTLLAAGMDLAGGEALLRRAADFEPDSAEVQALHGAALTFLDRPAEALAAFDRALAIDPDNTDLLYQSANMLQNLERQADAVVRLNRAIALDPYNAAPIFSRGTSLAITGHNAEARADFERVLELDTSGTQYASMATNFIDILDGLDAAKAAESAAP